MHTSDMLTGRHVCVCVELETYFTNQRSNEMARQGQAPLTKSTSACKSVTFSDTAEVIVLISICMLMTADTKMSLFQPNFCVENCNLRSFSAASKQTGPLHASHNTTQQALSTHLYSIVSALSYPSSMEKLKK